MAKRLHFPWSLTGAVIALLTIGILNLHSATYDLVRGGISPLVWSQLLWIAIGLLLGFIMFLLDYRILIRYAYPLYGFTLILLVLVLFFGKTVAGNRSWLQIGSFTFQPSEIAKLGLVLVLARYLADHPPLKRGYQVLELLKPGLLVGVPQGLIVWGRDMGSAIFFAVTAGSLLLFAGIERRAIILLVVFALLGGGVAYRYLLNDHQRARISAFLNPERDPRGAGYHLLQSKITVGSGRIVGKGYLKGMHSKLLYLPEKHTDFIFPVLAEEWGIVGSLGVMGLIGIVLVSGLQIASRARDRFGLFLALGVTAILFWQIAINLGGVLGLMPLTGVTLPLLSYGGSSMVTLLVGVGLLLNISVRRFMF